MRYRISAAALIVHDQQVLLVNHQAAGQFDFWLPPGGRLEGDESIFECARREAFEETGLSVEPDRTLYIQEFAEPGYHFCKSFILCSAFSDTLTLAHRVPDEDFLVDARFSHNTTSSAWMFDLKFSRGNSGPTSKWRIRQRGILGWKECAIRAVPLAI